MAKSEKIVCNVTKGLLTWICVRSAGSAPAHRGTRPEIEKFENLEDRP